ncbi:uncharacterized protein LOC128952288 [Oppia nitens]|uniref:uncharacterized protein LOC128952288 n=1 Tax=Oppia nitens TaxID=1686743 RepID=UPI0023D99E80|nr:uncharacterized protein LOC128952288 [Oppia nitens]
MDIRILLCINILIIILLVLIGISEINGQRNPSNPRNYGGQSSGKSPIYGPKEIEIAKQFWKKLGKDQKGQRKYTSKEAANAGKFRVANYQKLSPPSGTSFFDDIVAGFFPIGDKYAGAPDNIVSMGLFCVQTLVKGAIGVIYTTVRYPHKILLKVMIAIAALTIVPANALYCLNPFSIANFIKKGSLINTKQDDLVRLHEKFQVRLANTMDKYKTIGEIRKQSCCAYWQWQRESIKAVPKEAQDFLSQWYLAYFKLHEIVYCMKFTVAQQNDFCDTVEYDDSEPTRMLPRSWATLVLQMFTEFL